MLTEFVPIFVMILLALGLALSLFKLAEVLGPRRPRSVKASPYESGMDPVGTARERYSVKFYLVAMIFIVFDVEVVFMYPWAVSFGGFLDAGAGLGAFLVAFVFIVILFVGLVYDIKKGGLEWD
ncbi:MAG: NADH-quinone oxidoreductase subunit A [Rhodothermales bacterium]|nr:NADH-quinone oxidoreductase subunit A [Rhodothermales bacterium]